MQIMVLVWDAIPLISTQIVLSKFMSSAHAIHGDDFIFSEYYFTTIKSDNQFIHIGKNGNLRF